MKKKITHIRIIKNKINSNAVKHLHSARKGKDENEETKSSLIV